MGITGSILFASSHLCYFCSAIKKNSNLHDTWPCSTFRTNMHLGEFVCMHHSSHLNNLNFASFVSSTSVDSLGLVDSVGLCSYN